jgi:cobalamin biosynthesis Mg chelatase CobN
MTARRTIPGLIVAVAALFALAPFALASPAGSEYLPKVPQSGGSHSSGSGSGQSATTDAFQGTNDSATTTTGQDHGKKHHEKKQKSKKHDRSAALASASGGSGGGSSGSVLLSPAVLVILAGILLLFLWAIWQRRRTRRGSPSAKPRPARHQIAGPDNAP